jgi:hypothetical protein
MSESVILCEGFHDRAFWNGWLKLLGCDSTGFEPKTPGYPAPDPWGLPVSHGQFAYRSKSGRFLRVRQCGGRANVLPQARSRLNQRTTKQLLQLVINVDVDASAANPIAGAVGLHRKDVLHQVQQIDPSAAMNAAGEIEVDGGATRISLIRWEASDPATTPGLPDQQTLERMVCAALAAAYPARAAAVQHWLNCRPNPPQVDPKEHAWSYMAGWYAGHGCEAFYSHLWNEARVVSELESRLRASGAWQIAETLAS